MKKKNTSHRKPSKWKLIAGTLSGAGVTLCAVFGGVAACHQANEPQWDSSAPPYYSFGDGENPAKPSKDRMLIQAWGTVYHTVRGDIGYMGEKAPALNEPLPFMLYTQEDAKNLGIQHENYYKITVKCRDNGVLACRVLKADKLEKKDYRSLEQAAQDELNKARPGNNLQLLFSDFARQVVLFGDASSPMPKFTEVKCTNPLNYSCKVK
jgi:hypothetical protein